MDWLLLHVQVNDDRKMSFQLISFRDENHSFNSFFQISKRQRVYADGMSQTFSHVMRTLKMKIVLICRAVFGHAINTQFMLLFRNVSISNGNVHNAPRHGCHGITETALATINPFKTTNAHNTLFVPNQSETWTISQTRVHYLHFILLLNARSLVKLPIWMFRGDATHNYE